MISVQFLKESFLNKIMKTKKMKEKYEKKKKKSGDSFIFKKKTKVTRHFQSENLNSFLRDLNDSMYHHHYDLLILNEQQIKTVIVYFVRNS